MTDSLKVYDILKDAQIPDSQARAITQAIRESDAAVVLDIRAVLTERFDLIDQRFATKSDLRAGLAELKAELMRWMFTFWVGQLAATVAIVKLWR